MEYMISSVIASLFLLIGCIFVVMMKKRFELLLFTTDPKKVSPRDDRSLIYREIMCRASGPIVINRFSSGLSGYVFGSLSRPPENCSDLLLQCNLTGLVCLQFLKYVSMHIASGCICVDDVVALWRYWECERVLREKNILLEDVQQNLEYGIDDRFRFFVELFTLWCGVAHDLYTVSEDNFRHQICFSEGENYEFVVVTCCLYFYGDECHGFLKLELLVNEFYVEMLMTSGGLQVMVPHGDSSLTIFYVSGIVVMVQPLNIFFKQEACYLEVLISFVIESFLQISFSGFDFLQQATSSFLFLISCESDSTVKIVIKLKIGESGFGSDFLQQAKSSFLFLIYREFDSTGKIVIKLKIGESGFISPYGDLLSIVINRFYMSASLFGFICGRFLCQRSMMILLAVSHCVLYLIHSDISDSLGCSAEYDNGSICMDMYPSVSGFVEFKTPSDLLLVEDRMLIKASWFSTLIVLGFQGIDTLILLTRRSILHLFTGCMVVPLFSMKTDSSLENMIFILLHCPDWQVNGFMTTKDVLQELQPSSRIIYFELLQTSHLLQRYSEDFFEHSIVVYSKWVGSILDLLYCSLPRPPERDCALVWFSFKPLRFTRMLIGKLELHTLFLPT